MSNNSILNNFPENQNISIDVVRRLLDEDKRIVAYRPSWKTMTGSVTSAILLQQIRFHWVNNGRKPFYKFFSRPEKGNKAYRPGDSFVEELGFTIDELRGALKRVGKRLKKKDFDNPNILNDTFFGYFQDQKHLTWFYFNEAYFEEKIIKHYEETEEKSRDRKFPDGKFPDGKFLSGFRDRNFPSGYNHIIIDNNDNNEINKLNKIGFDIAGAKKLKKTYQGKQPFNELVNLWYKNYKGSPLPKSEIPKAYYEIQAGNPPPKPTLKFKFDVVSEAEAREAILYWKERGQTYTDGDMAYATMISNERIGN